MFYDDKSGSVSNLYCPEICAFSSYRTLLPGGGSNSITWTKYAEREFIITSWISLSGFINVGALEQNSKYKQSFSTFNQKKSKQQTKYNLKMSATRRTRKTTQDSTLWLRIRAIWTASKNRVQKQRPRKKLEKTKMMKIII